MRGRTFATLYAVVRLCLLLSLTVSPLFADLFAWIAGSVNGETIRLGGFVYSFPGVRLSLWGGAVLTMAAGLYARRSMQRYHATYGKNANHPSLGATVDSGADAEGSPS